jgi:bla regulator protein blaR1
MTAPQFLELAVSLSLQVALVIALTQAICRFARRRVIVQCRLWTCCYVLMLLIVAGGLLLPHWRPMRPWSELSPATIVGMASFETHTGRMAFMVWLVGVAAATASFVASWVIQARGVRRCRPIPSEQLGLSGELPMKDGNGRTVAFVSGPDVSAPCCWQLHQPYVVLPYSVLQLGRRQRAFIIRHELEHLRLQHPLQVFLQHVVGIVFWFHPMVWWASNQSALIREFACDEAALETRTDVVDYLRTLLTIVEQTAGHAGQTPGMLAFGIGHGVIARRARRLVFLEQSGTVTASRDTTGWKSLALAATAATGLVAATVWMPVDVLVSARADWSPWPHWSAGLLHDFGIVVRDYELYDKRTQIHEVLEEVSTDRVEEH